MTRLGSLFVHIVKVHTTKAQLWSLPLAFSGQELAESKDEGNTDKKNCFRSSYEFPEFLWF